MSSFFLPKSHDGAKTKSKVGGKRKFESNQRMPKKKKFMVGGNSRTKGDKDENERFKGRYFVEGVAHLRRALYKNVKASCTFNERRYFSISGGNEEILSDASDVEGRDLDEGKSYGLSDGDESDVETAEEKRLRLAKKYLEEIECQGKYTNSSRLYMKPHLALPAIKLFFISIHYFMLRKRKNRRAR